MTRRGIRWGSATRHGRLRVVVRVQGSAWEVREVVQETQPVTLSRRQMLRVASLGTIGLVGGLLAACSAPAPAAPAAPAAPTTAAPPATVVPPVAKATDSVAAANPTQAVAAQPTAAQAAIKPGRQ